MTSSKTGLHSGEANQLPYQVVMQPMVDGAAVELLEDLGTHAKTFHSSEGEMVLLCPLHNFVGVFGP